MLTCPQCINGGCVQAKRTQRALDMMSRNGNLHKLQDIYDIDKAQKR